MADNILLVVSILWFVLLCVLSIAPVWRMKFTVPEPHDEPIIPEPPRKRQRLGSEALSPRELKTLLDD